MTHLNILLIDQSVEEFQWTNRVLQDCYDGEYTLTHAKTLAKGKHLIQTKKPDLVLLDLSFGRNLAALGFDKKSNAPVIIRSSRIDATYIRKQKMAHVYDFIDKFNLRKRLTHGLLEAL
ncbi:response regulator [Hellea balneolensis]|uniref:response regulator n=1 Tax=Hellea balneolensis TaxID=287478 RepID=UPI000405B916|nr:response regulator [Hellea balneolensis]